MNTGTPCKGTQPSCKAEGRGQVGPSTLRVCAVLVEPRTRATQEIANAGQGLNLLEEQSHARGRAAPDLVGAGAIPIGLFGQSDDVD